MPKFDPARAMFTAESLEPATDPVGTVVGYYLKLANDKGEIFVSEQFVRDHFTAAPSVIKPTAPAADTLAGAAAAAAKDDAGIPFKKA